jgi:peptidyl-prolyl cis-trans isomerase C
MTRKWTTALVCISAALALVFAAGCGKNQGHVVAKVGDRKITAEEIDRFLSHAGARFASADQELSFKRQLLDSMINQNLLIIGAYEHNLDNHEEVLRAIEGEKIKFLLDALIDKEIVSKSMPSEAEIKDWYVRMGEEIKVSHIVVDSLATAEEVLAKLKDGAPFGELAVKYSQDQSVKRNQGDLGWVSWGMMVDEFQNAAFRLKPGEVSAPVKTDFGYHIIKLIDRRKVEHRPSYAESKDYIRNLIMDRRQQKLAREYQEMLKEKYPISIEKPTCEFVLNKLEMMYPETINGHPRWRNNIDPSVLDLAEKDLVLGKYTGGQLTIGQYLDNLRRIPPDKRPDFDKYDSLAEIVFQMSLMDIMAVEAKEKGIENSPRYKDNIRRFKEMAMADVMRNDTIPYDVEVDEGEVEEYYDSHPEEFTTPTQFDVYEIQTADSGKAASWSRTTKTEREFKKIAASETIRPGKKQVSGKLGIITENEFPELYKAAADANGVIAGPVKVNTKYSVLWISRRIPPVHRALGDVKKQIVDKLTKQKGDALYSKWIDEMKKRVPIEVYDDVLSQSVDTSKYISTDTTATTASSG